eukprot:8027537-Prorocentrum_lima.AAC.1
MPSLLGCSRPTFFAPGSFQHSCIRAEERVHAACGCRSATDAHFRCIDVLHELQRLAPVGFIRFLLRIIGCRLQ